MKKGGGKNPTTTTKKTNFQGTETNTSTPTGIVATLLWLNDLRGEEMASDREMGHGAIMARPSSFVSTSFSILFH